MLYVHISLHMYWAEKDSTKLEEDQIQLLKLTKQKSAEGNNSSVAE